MWFVTCYFVAGGLSNVCNLTHFLISKSTSYPHLRVLHTPIVAMQFLHGILPLFFAHYHAKKKRAKIKHSRYRKKFFRTLSIEESHHWYRKILQCALIPLKLSPWQKLITLQNNQAYITMLGFDCNSFDQVLKKFVSPMFSGHTSYVESGMIVELVKTCGQKREVQPEDCLGLVLVWTRTRGLLNVL